ncbi:MAG: ABC transporter ATP-binding protein [Lachnospiraceae bacterium]|jgi:branched-chain amino acid transport system ATP-binding protein|nr:ABC transporter ATP-binding protein [Lachnospiraceae bacterium]
MALLEIKNATKAFGGLKANEDVTFNVEAGSIVGVVGPNGAGKTTLFNSISRTHDLTSGQIIFDGKDITKSKAYQACAAGMGRTYQIPQALEDMTVLENITVGALLKRSKVFDAMEKAKEISEFCGLSEFNEKLASGLNVMQKKRLEIARALAGEPKILLLDETMAGLNGVERDEAIELIRRINKSGVTILMIEHVMKVVMSVSDKVVVIVSGKKLMEGTPDEVVTHPEVINAYLGGGHNAGR